MRAPITIVLGIAVVVGGLMIALYLRDQGRIRSFEGQVQCDQWAEEVRHRQHELIDHQNLDDRIGLERAASQLGETRPENCVPPGFPAPPKPI